MWALLRNALQSRWVGRFFHFWRYVIYARYLMVPCCWHDFQASHYSAVAQLITKFWGVEKWNARNGSSHIPEEKSLKFWKNMVSMGYVMGCTPFCWSTWLDYRLEFRSSTCMKVWQVFLLLGQASYGLFLGWHCYTALMNPAAGIRTQSGLIYASIVFVLLSANNYAQVIHDQEYVRWMHRYKTFVTVKKESKSYFMPRACCFP